MFIREFLLRMMSRRWEKGSKGVLEQIRSEQIRVFLGTSDSLHFLKSFIENKKKYKIPFYQTVKLREIKY